MQVSDVNNLLKRFDDMQQMMRKLGKMQKMMGKMGGKMPGMAVLANNAWYKSPVVNSAP